MKKMKKILAMLLTAVMVMGMSVTALAENGESGNPTTTTESIKNEPNSDNKVLVEIDGFYKAVKNADGTTVLDKKSPDGVTVTLYQIASAQYDADGSGFIKYVWTDKITGVAGLKEGEEVSFPKNADGTNKEYPTDKIIEIANNLKGDAYNTTELGSTTGAEKHGKYSLAVPAGVYVALITGSTNGYVYNPVLLTATYSATPNAQGGLDVSLVGGSIAIDSAKYINGTTAVAKRSTPDVKKEITSENKTDTKDGESIKTASVGDVIEYKITPTMPSYPANAVNKTFFISDTMNKGLTFDYNSLDISLDGVGTLTKNYVMKTIEKADGTEKAVMVRQYKNGNDVVAESVKTTDDNGKEGFNINFIYTKLIKDKTSGATYVPTITYKAIINDSAVVGGNGNENDVTLVYSKTPNKGTDWDDPTETPKNDPNAGVEYGNKEDSKTVYTYQLAFLKIDSDTTDTNAKGLKNAIFGIYAEKKTAEVEGKEVEVVDKLIDTVTTNEHGFAVSSQVGAGTYYIKEIKAPDGYSLNETIYPITASWVNATTTTTTTTTKSEYTSTANGTPQVGWLVGEGDTAVFSPIDAYEEKMENGVSKIYQVNHDNAVSTEVTNVKKAYLVSTSTTIKNSVEELTNTNSAGTGAVKLGTSIPNTKLASLPSTGGIGTTIFTVGGCAIMILAAGMFFVSRRRASR